MRQRIIQPPHKIAALPPVPPGVPLGCTGNPFVDAASPSRIDFIFVRGNGVQVKQSKIIFNGANGAFVSDHCAILTEISRRRSPVSLLELLLLRD